MLQMRPFLNLLLSEDGVTTVEYIVMLTMIIFVLLISITAFGNSAQSMWLTVIGRMESSW